MSARTKKIPMLRLSIAIPLDGFEKVQKAAKADKRPYTVWCRDILLYAADQRLDRKKRKTTPRSSTSTEA